MQSAAKCPFLLVFHTTSWAGPDSIGTRAGTEGSGGGRERARNEGGEGGGGEHPDDAIEACIFKVYDDCRQDSLVIQVVRLLRDAFLAAGLALSLVPYTVIPSRIGGEHAPGGILQCVKNVKSR